MNEPSPQPLAEIPQPGGAETRFSENIDLANPKDAALVNNLLVQHGRRWDGLPWEKRRRLSELAINAAIEVYEVGRTEDNPNLENLPLKAVIQMESMNQKDEEAKAKDERLDAGKLTESIEFVVKAPRVIGT
jgi:TRAP-type C4-dicarboxylate transport system substrate-binding protein